jgi:ADP-heptose:LPS heptosyltransferase/GT2 family glycosyltransferase
MKKITAIIPAYKNSNWLDLCLTSIKASTVYKQIEIIVVANSQEMAMLDVLSKHSTIQVIKNEKNIGVAASFNAATELATTDLICFMHTDTLVAQNTFEILINNYEILSGSNPKTIGIMPITNFCDDNLLVEDVGQKEKFKRFAINGNEPYGFDYISKTIADFYGSSKSGIDCIQLYAEKLSQLNNSCTPLGSIYHHCLVVNKQHFIDLGMFDVDFYPIGFFEKIFYDMAKKAGKSIYLCRGAFVFHNGGITSNSNGMNKEFAIENNKKVYERKISKIFDNEGNLIELINRNNKNNLAKSLVNKPATKIISSPKNALFIRHGGIGDIIMTMPIVNDFKKRFPECEINYMCFKGFSSIVKGFGIVDNIIELDFVPGFETWQEAVQTNSQFYYLYDYVLDWTFYPELSQNYHVKDRVDIFAEKYDGIDELIMPLFCAEKTAAINELLSRLTSKQNIMLCPQSTAKCRSWSWKNVKSFCKASKGKFGNSVNIIIVDSFRHDDIIDSNITNLCGKLELKDLIHLTSIVDATISTDTGVFHMSNVLNKPCLGLFGSICPELRTKYYKNRIDFVYMNDALKCVPCFDVGCDTIPCLNAISNDIIINKLEKLLNEPKLLA